MPACLIEARKRTVESGAKAPGEGPRFGFTVTKKLGNAVTRNRIRRRLKAAVSELATANARAGFDYVVVARSAAFDRSYADIINDLTRAFAILNGGAGSKPSGGPKKQPGKALA